jgi:DnaJ like chaperone protein
MNWWGKVVGGALGWAIGGPIGALLGIAIGHNFDGRQGLNWSALGGDAERVQTAFFTTTFSVMGHVAKADGRVSENEIRMARAVMSHMNLNQAQTDTAMRLFREGKQSSFPLDGVMLQFRRECHMRRDLFRMFLEIQLQAALADGNISSAEREVLERIGGYLNVSPRELAQLEALIRAARQRYDWEAGGRQQRSATTARASLDEAYAVLGVSKSASDDEVKKAYRKLMSQHHPDKLAAKGLPEEMMKMAQEKAQDITRAYDIVKETRDM